MYQQFELLKKADDTLLLVDEAGKEHVLREILLLHPDARVYAFVAKMGVGKTTFISQLSHEMGTDDTANSPTFAIVNVYDVQQPYKGEVYHFDCYRLKDLREAVDLGAEDYLYSGNYCFIEWPRMIDALLPEDTVYARIVPQENGDRQLTIEKH